MNLKISLPITVVIPAYQAEEHIVRALESVARQTSQPGEVLVVDDGSHDRTAQLSRAAGARVIEQANGGVASARNTGILEARFPWIAMLDADDRWFPQKLEQQWLAHEKQPDAHMIWTDYSVVGEDGSDRGSAFSRLPHFASAPRTSLGDAVSLFRREDFTRLVAQANVLSSSTPLLERAWLLENELFYQPDLPRGDNFWIAEDYEWLLRALRFSDVLIVERSLADYRDRPDSLSARRGRLAYGDVMLGEFIAKNPEKYADGAPADFGRRRPLHQRRSALEYLRQGEFGAAADTLGRALREKFDPCNTALFTLASIGRWSPAASAIQRAREYRLKLKRRLPSFPKDLGKSGPSEPNIPVSVVIPAHNVAAYLEGAIASVRAQTLQPSEIIVVDDGSTDSTREVAERAGVRVITQTQGGAASARNAGVAAACSPWIAFLDADDRWAGEKLEAQWAAHLLAPDARLLATDLTFVFERGGELASAQAAHPSYGSTLKCEITPGVVKLDRRSLARTLPRGQSLTPSTWLVERNLLLAEPFDSKLPVTPLYQVAEDFEWLLRALRETEVVVVEKPLTTYFVRAAGNLSAGDGRQRFGDLKLGEMVDAVPDRYLAGAADAFRAFRPDQARIATLAYLREGNASGAMAVLDSVARGSRGPQWLAMRALSYGVANPVGHAALRGARKLRRSLARA